MAISCHSPLNTPAQLLFKLARFIQSLLAELPPLHFRICTPSNMYMPSDPDTVVTLLFVHGGGFCKEIWTPIIRRVQQSSLLSATSGVQFKYEAIDLPYHGSESRVFKMGEEESMPRVTCSISEESAFSSYRVEHPANSWVEWTTIAVLRVARSWHNTDGEVCATETKRTRRFLVGVGHSMGASALLNAVATQDGLFSSLILFEPIYGHPDEFAASAALLDLVVAATLQRTSTWSSISVAEYHIATAKRFAKWDRESLRSWFGGAIVPHPYDCFSVTLGCPPELEAAFSCGPPLWLSQHTHASLKCQVSIHYGENTRLFQPHVFADLAERYPFVYRFADKPIKGCTHLMVVEDPAACATEVLGALKFQLGTLLQRSRM